MTADAALAELQAGRPETALALLDAEPPLEGHAAHHATRGMALLSAGRPVDALTALRTAVALGDADPATLLNLALAEERAGDVDRARRLMHRLQDELPDWDQPPLRLAESLRAAGCNAGAETAYQRVLAINPRREEALLGLAGLLLARGAATDARELLLRCCGIAPGRADVWHVLGLALMVTGDAALAHTALIEAQRLEPDAPEHALKGIEAAQAADAAEAELVRLQEVAAGDPLNPVWLLARGVLLERTGDRDAAIDALDAATALAPGSSLAATLLGGVLARSNRHAAANTALRRAAELDPENVQLLNARAVVLLRMHRHAEAHALLLQAADGCDEQVPVLCNLATAAVCLGLHDAALAAVRRAIARDPDAVLPRRTLCNTLPYCDGMTGAELLAAQRACAAVSPSRPPPDFANVPDADRPLTIGLMSGSLKTHPVGWLTVAGCETLDPAQFSLVCLAQGVGPTDPIARRYRAVARDWIETDMLDDVALAAAAREAGIDVLIDLGGYGEAGRMPACRHRLAPVQVKWVGMQNHSTGLPEMDWIITDRWETPPSLEHLYSERVLRLDDGYVCYSPPPYAPAVAPLPALANGQVTFGCFNNLAKITGRVVATWAEVLHRVPGSRLVLKTHQFSDAATCDRVRAAFVAQGIDPRAHRAARRVASSRVHGRVQRHRHGAGPVPLFRRTDHVRGAVDGRADGHVARRLLRLPAFAEPHEQCRADRLGCARRAVLRRAGRGEGGRPGCAGDAARRAAGAGQGQPVVRCAALRAHPGRGVAACLAGVVRPMNAFSSFAYWEARYRAGGTSGAGSAGRLLHFKADVINGFVADNTIGSVLDLGCGDGNLLSLLRVPSYVGVDVSPTALAGCITRFPQHRFVPFDAVEAEPAAELALCIDVIFHLVEDGGFRAHDARAVFARDAVRADLCQQCCMRLARPARAAPAVHRSCRSGMAGMASVGAFAEPVSIRSGATGSHVVRRCLCVRPTGLRMHVTSAG